MLAGVTLAGFLLSFLSFFLVGTAGPKYNLPPPVNFELCQGASAHLDTRQIHYTNGFPFSASGKAAVDVSCGDGGDRERYVPGSLEILKTWQLYANAALYIGVIMGAAAIVEYSFIRPRDQR